MVQSNLRTMDTLNHSQLTSLLQIPTFLQHKLIMVIMELVAMAGMAQAAMEQAAMELVAMVMEEMEILLQQLNSILS